MSTIVEEKEEKMAKPRSGRVNRASKLEMIKKSW